MISTNKMLEKLAGLVGTTDVNGWENEFLTSILALTQNGKLPSVLSDKQVECMERIYRNLFA